MWSKRIFSSNQSTEKVTKVRAEVDDVTKVTDEGRGPHRASPLWSSDRSGAIAYRKSWTPDTDTSRSRSSTEGSVRYEAEGGTADKNRVAQDRRRPLRKPEITVTSPASPGTTESVKRRRRERTQRSKSIIEHASSSSSRKTSQTEPPASQRRDEKAARKTSFVTRIWHRHRSTEPHKTRVRAAIPTGEERRTGEEAVVGGRAVTPQATRRKFDIVTLIKSKWKSSSDIPSSVDGDEGGASDEEGEWSKAYESATFVPQMVEYSGAAVDKLTIDYHVKEASTKTSIRLPKILTRRKTIDESIRTVDHFLVKFKSDELNNLATAESLNFRTAHRVRFGCSSEDENDEIEVFEITEQENKNYSKHGLGLTVKIKNRLSSSKLQQDFDKVKI